jgi:uncharacterized protein (TIGR02284 family)
MSDNITSQLNELIETSKDGEQGFMKAARDAQSPELKTLFSQAHGAAPKARASCRTSSAAWAVIPRRRAAPPPRCTAAGST